MPEVILQNLLELLARGVNDYMLELIVKLYVELLAVAGELICGDEALVLRLRSWKLTNEKNS